MPIIPMPVIAKMKFCHVECHWASGTVLIVLHQLLAVIGSKCLS